MSAQYVPPRAKEDSARKDTPPLAPARPEDAKLQLSTIMAAISALISLLAICVYHKGLFGSSAVASDSERDIIDTGYAKYLGNRTYPNTVAYLGIPYAEPPLRDLRFRAPLPLDTARVAMQAVDGVIDATKYPDFCIQGTTGSGDAGGAGTEDCLKVNIYAPVGAKTGSNLPVLVYIHGGGYVFGNPANWPFDHWVAQSPNVVIVSIYYRLSSFGFLSHPSFRHGINGDFNAGFLDQVQALKWVKHNIASFGGNPNKVTINGESAGGSSVQLHLVANEGETLFQQAIAQSVYRTPLPTPEQQEPLFHFYANFAGCGQGTVAEKLECLRMVDVSHLARAQDAGKSGIFTGSKYNAWRPVVDGKVITDFPTKSILEGKFTKVPLIVGATTNETLSWGDNATAALQTFFPSLTTSAASSLLSHYPLKKFASLTELQFQTVTGDSEVRCGRTLLGLAYGKGSKSWTYRYNQRTPGTSAVHHAAENWMMFKGTSTGINGTTTFHTMSPTDIAFSQEIIAYWLSFVRSGNPDTFKLVRSPSWSEYLPENTRIVLQNAPAESPSDSGSFLETESADELTRCLFIAGQVGQQQN